MRVSKKIAELENRIDKLSEAIYLPYWFHDGKSRNKIQRTEDELYKLIDKLHALLEYLNLEIIRTEKRTEYSVVKKQKTTGAK